MRIKDYQDYGFLLEMSFQLPSYESLDLYRDNGYVISENAREIVVSNPKEKMIWHKTQRIFSHEKYQAGVLKSKTQKSYSVWIDNSTYLLSSEKTIVHSQFSDEQGFLWFDTVDPTWKTMIGAQNTELTQVGCESITEDYYGNVLVADFFEGEGDCDEYSSGLTDCFPIYETVEIVVPSDGFVLESSATNVENLHYDLMLMLDSGHLQMRNDSNTEEAMNEIFIEGLDGDFFKTDKR